MRKRWVWLMGGLIIAVALSVVLTRPRARGVDPEVHQRSLDYIAELGALSRDALSMEQKLLLLHSYYNVNDYKATIELGEDMVPELRSLPPVRQAPFVNMVEQAFRANHQATQARAFRDKVTQQAN